MGSPQSQGWCSRVPASVVGGTHWTVERLHPSPLDGSRADFRLPHHSIAPSSVAARYSRPESPTGRCYHLVADTHHTLRGRQKLCILDSRCSDEIEFLLVRFCFAICDTYREREHTATLPRFPSTDSRLRDYVGQSRIALRAANLADRTLRTRSYRPLSFLAERSPV